MRTTVKIGLLLAICAFGAAGCGVRGSLEAPPEAKADKTATADSGQGKPEGAAPRQHKDFVLDGLIR
jgi:predicted small lipoprotein YifL